MKIVALLLGLCSLVYAQEASSGIDLQATVTGEAGFSDQWRAGLRSILYPTIKLGQHWTVAGAIEAISRPWDPQEFTEAGYGIRGRIIQATAGYSVVGRKSSLIVRAGQMPSAFGSFMLRYDDAENPMLPRPQLTGITTILSRPWESRAFRPMSRRVSGTGERSLQTLLLRIHGASSIKTNMATGPAEVGIPFGKGFGSVLRDIADLISIGTIRLLSR